MQYNLVHRGAVIQTFDSGALEPDELQELKSLKGRYFHVERAVPDRLPQMAEGFDNLAGIKNGWVYTGSPRYS